MMRMRKPGTIIPFVVFLIMVGSLVTNWIRVHAEDDGVAVVLNPTSLTFTAQAGGTAPPAKTVSVTSSVSTRWKGDSAEILVVIESPFQQSRRGILEQGIAIRDRYGSATGLPRRSHHLSPMKSGRSSAVVAKYRCGRRMCRMGYVVSAGAGVLRETIAQVRVYLR